MITVTFPEQVEDPIDFGTLGVSTIRFAGTDNSTRGRWRIVFCSDKAISRTTSLTVADMRSTLSGTAESLTTAPSSGSQPESASRGLHAGLRNGL
jgi:hypothetical protein